MKNRKLLVRRGVVQRKEKEKTKENFRRVLIFVPAPQFSSWAPRERDWASLGLVLLICKRQRHRLDWSEGFLLFFRRRIFRFIKILRSMLNHSIHKQIKRKVLWLKRIWGRARGLVLPLSRRNLRTRVMSSDLHLKSSQWLSYEKHSLKGPRLQAQRPFIEVGGVCGQRGESREVVWLQGKWSYCPEMERIQGGGSWPGSRGGQTAAYPVLSGPHCGWWVETSPRQEEGLRTNPKQWAELWIDEAVDLGTFSSKVAWDFGITWGLIRPHPRPAESKSVFSEVPE